MEVDLKPIDKRFIKGNIIDIKKEWLDGDIMEYLAMEWAIHKYLEKYPYGKYEKTKEWISVDDRLPKKEGEYIVFYYTKKSTYFSGREDVTCLNFFDNEWDDGRYAGNIRERYFVTDWQPKPKPPQK